MLEERLSPQEIHVLVRAASFECGACHGAICFEYRASHSGLAIQAYEEMMRQTDGKEIPPACAEAVTLDIYRTRTAECILCGGLLKPWCAPPAARFRFLSPEAMEEHYQDFWQNRDMGTAAAIEMVRRARATLESGWG